MAAWSTYSLEDFVLFSPRVYWRMFELQNAAVWPAQFAAVAAATLLVAALVRPSPALRFAAFASLAAIWGWVGLSFLGDRYATVNWAVEHIVPVFVAQGVLLAAVGLRCAMPGGRPSVTRSAAGLALMAYALVLHPLVAPLAGRPWQAAELFGVAPDPTAIATIGFVALALRGASAWLLYAIPALWCLASALTLYALGAPEAWIPFATAVLGGFACACAYRPPSAR